jgi:plastocyanin
MTFVHRPWRMALALGVLLSSAVVVTVLASPLDVSIVDKTFQPATITVKAGDTVTWTVTKSIGEPHSVTSGKPGTDQGKDFDSGITLKDNGQSFQFTFDKPGTYDYFCQVHPTVMTGQVIVAAAGQSAAASGAPASAGPATTAAPAASPAGSPAASPAATEAPVAPEDSEPVPPENKYIGAGILGAALVLLFAANWYWRRLNPG